MEKERRFKNKKDGSILSTFDNFIIDIGGGITKAKPFEIVAYIFNSPDWEEIFPIKYKYKNCIYKKDGDAFKCILNDTEGHGHWFCEENKSYYETTPLFDVITNDSEPIWDESELEEKLKTMRENNMDALCEGIFKTINKMREETINKMKDNPKETAFDIYRRSCIFVDDFSGIDECSPIYNLISEVRAWQRQWDLFDRDGGGEKKRPKILQNFIKLLIKRFEVTEKSPVVIGSENKPASEFGKDKQKFMSCFIEIDKLTAKNEKLEAENKILKEWFEEQMH